MFWSHKRIWNWFVGEAKYKLKEVYVYFKSHQIIAYVDGVVIVAAEESETVQVSRRSDKKATAIGLNINYQKAKYMELGST